MRPLPKLSVLPNASPPDVEARELDRALRAELSETEYRVLQARLTGAIKAVQTLRDRAPEVARRVWGEWAVHASPNLLDDEARGWIEGVVAELLEVERSDNSHVQHVQELLRKRKRMLKVVNVRRPNTRKARAR